MAEYVYTISDFSLTSTWKRVTAQFGSVTETRGYDIVSASTTKSFTLSGIALGTGERIKRVMLTATLSRSGTTDYSERITVNELGFSNGSKKLDAAEFTPGGTWSANFYFCASGNTGSASLNVSYDYSCTLHFSNVKLTVTTGTGSDFDGLVGSLEDGTKILIDEGNGVQGIYSVVHHGYNNGLCLLWRDKCISDEVAFNQNANTFLSSNNGKLDAYLNDTFYNALPNATKPYIQQAIYPTLDSGGNYYGTVTNITRYVCTPSVRELHEDVGAAEWNGTPLDYLGTCDCDEIYWTRSISQSSSGYAYRISADGGSFTYNRSYASGVRPCFCVLESQMVMPSADGTYYILTSAVDAPTSLKFNGTASNLYNQQRDITAILSWTASASSLVSGYEIWRCTTAGGTYEFYGAVTAANNGTIATEFAINSGSKGFTEYFYKVKAITAANTDYLDSELSESYRSLATKKTNAHYYDGGRWLLAATKHYNGSTWNTSEGAKYYNGAEWYIPSTPLGYTNVLKSVGYSENMRYSTSGAADTTATGWDLTGYIPAKVGDVIRLSNITWYPSTENSGRGSLYWFNSSKTFISNNNVTSTSSLTNWSPVYDTDGNVVQITVPSGVTSSAAYLRICCQDINSESIITVNEEII